MIELSGVSRHFGGVRAVDGLDLVVGQGQVFGLIGPNGSGKSTTLDLISGLQQPSAGRILMGGRDIARLPLHERAGCGLARTFQHSRVFGRLSVHDNLRATGAGGDEISRALRCAGLAHRRDALAADLSSGERRRLELARALVAAPRLLLLDEPAGGMDSQEIEALRGQIADLRRAGVTILLVDHIMPLVMSVTDRIAVLDFGRKIAEGTPAEILANPAVRAAYLGGPNPGAEVS